MNRLTHIYRSVGAALLALAIFVVPGFAQDDCRGWMTSCASVEVRAEGDRLILFAPNLSLEEGDEAVGDASEPLDGEAQLSSVDAPPSGMEFATPVDDHADPECKKYEYETNDPESYDGGEERDDCVRPIGAIFMLALPTTVYLLSQGDGGDPVVTGPPGSPVAGPQPDDDSGDDTGTGSDDGGTADGAGGDDGGSTAGDSGGNSGDGGGSTGGNSAGGGDAGGGSTGGGSTGGGDTGGGSGSNPADDGGDDGDFGPYHPTAEDLPPISQVPEPISTTLFGIGLAGYAGARLRKRRGEIVEEDA